MVDINLFEADDNTNTVPTLAERVAAHKAAKKKRGPQYVLPDHPKHTIAYRNHPLYWRNSKTSHTAAFKKFLCVVYHALHSADNAADCLSVLGCGPFYLRGLLYNNLPFFHCGGRNRNPLMYPHHLDHFIVDLRVPFKNILARCASSEQAIAKAFHYTNIESVLTELGMIQKPFTRDTPMPTKYEPDPPSKGYPWPRLKYLTIAESFDALQAEIQDYLQDPSQ